MVSLWKETVLSVCPNPPKRVSYYAHRLMRTAHSLISPDDLLQVPPSSQPDSPTCCTNPTWLLLIYDYCPCLCAYRVYKVYIYTHVYLYIPYLACWMLISLYWLMSDMLILLCWWKSDMLISQHRFISCLLVRTFRYMVLWDGTHCRTNSVKCTCNLFILSICCMLNNNKKSKTKSNFVRFLVSTLSGNLNYEKCRNLWPLAPPSNVILWVDTLGLDILTMGIWSQQTQWRLWKNIGIF